MNHFNPNGSTVAVKVTASTARAVASQPGLRMELRKLTLFFRRQIARFAVARRHQHDIEQLMGMDDRMLKDIGLTRSDLLRETRTVPDAARNGV